MDLFNAQVTNKLGEKKGRKLSANVLPNKVQVVKGNVHQY